MCSKMCTLDLMSIYIYPDTQVPDLAVVEYRTVAVPGTTGSLLNTYHFKTHPMIWNV